MNDNVHYIAILGAVALLIPILGIVGGTVILPLIRFKERQLELQAELTAEKAAQYAAHVERLEQRVRVLERIATEEGKGLSNEIEALREALPPVN